MASSTDPAYLAVDEGPDASATITGPLVLCTFFVGLRFWGRWGQGIYLGSDDWTLAAALVLCWCAGGVVWGMISAGLGKHAPAVPLDTAITFAKWLFVSQFVYVALITMIKTSVILMYLRVFPSESFRVYAFVLQAVAIAWAIAICFVAIFGCTPINKAWLGELVEGHCINMRASFIGNAVPNIVLDISILCLPVVQVWKLQMNLTQRLSICFVFLLGSFVVFTSAYRFTTLLKFDAADATYTTKATATWSVIEGACGIISACLPTLRPLLAKISNQFSLTPGGSNPTPKRSGSAFLNPAIVTIGGSSGGTTSVTATKSNKSRGIRSRHDADAESDEYPLNERIHIKQTLDITESRTGSATQLEHNAAHEDRSPI